MNRDKQIEEMANDLYTCHDEYVRDGDDWVTDYNSTAKRLYNAGYRKSSDVAREIFEEIEEGAKAAVSALQFENNPIHRKVKHETYSSLMRFIKTIEEKYTESEKDNEKNIR